jgi:mannitol/fructose-specific phosphotransferase system IIA component
VPPYTGALTVVVAHPVTNATDRTTNTQFKFLNFPDILKIYNFNRIVFLILISSAKLDYYIDLTEFIIIFYSYACPSFSDITEGE